MNQNIHAWISIFFTVMALFMLYPERFFIDRQDELAWAIFPIQIIMPLLVFAIWLFIIV